MSQLFAFESALIMGGPHCKLIHRSITVVASHGHMCSSYLGPWESTGPEGHGHWESSLLGKGPWGQWGREGGDRHLGAVRDQTRQAWQSAVDKCLPQHPTSTATSSQLVSFNTSSFLLNNKLTRKYGNFQTISKFLKKISKSRNI